MKKNDEYVSFLIRSPKEIHKRISEAAKLKRRSKTGIYIDAAVLYLSILKKEKI